MKKIGLLLSVGLLLQAAHAASPYSASLGFSSTQGTNQWSYLQESTLGGSATAMTFVSGAWRTTDAGQTGWLLGSDTHPGNPIFTVRRWTAPSTGVVSITGRVYKQDVGGGAGVVATVQHNSSTIWSRTVGSSDSVGFTTDEALGDVAVSTGDTIDFVIGDNGTFGFDRTGWDPTVTYVSAYNSTTGFTSTQGANQWYYLQRPAGGTTTSNLSYSTGAWRTTDSGQTGWMQGGATHPGNGVDTVRQWLAPAAGTISVSGRVYKQDTGGGAGIVAKVEKNGTALWTKTVAYNDSTGYTTDAALGNVTVATGDKINFAVNDNGVYANDQTGWSPTINYTGNTATSWDLNTSDTLLTLTIAGNAPVITRLVDANNGWNWVTTPLTVPLLNMCYVGGAFQNPAWTYSSAAVDTTSGTKVTLTFTGTSPSLTLTQVWWARPGVGPVEVTTSVTNNSGGNVVFNYADLISGDLTVTADAATTLWQFSRSNVRSGSDPYFTTGTLKTSIGANTLVPSVVSNDINAGAYVLPFEMLDVGASHGAYFGFENDFGLFNTATYGNAQAIRMWEYMQNGGSITEANGATLTIPGWFVGTYAGSVEVGSNHMKAWFYTYKMTPTIRANTNEPLTELSIPCDTYSGSVSFFANNPIASWGVELGKEDYDWTADAGGPYFGNSWDPSSAWSGDMNLGSQAHAAGIKLSLYMGNTYKGADLATSAGVSSEEAALEGRYNGTATGFAQTSGSTGYDFWRSDELCEATVDYGSHLGFMQVLDYMIANHPNFRWENCSSGGTKKSFDLLQRQSVMTTEDSGANSGAVENWRMAFYANSYMINPVQLKDDNADPAYSSHNALNYQARSGFLGAWMYGTSGGGTIATEYTTHNSLYKTYQRPILRGADVYHILPICDGTHWDGLEFFNASLNKGSVLLFKPNSGVGTSPTIKLQGLNPTATYTLKFQDRSTMNPTYASVSGSTLMTTGFTISGTTSDCDSEIVWINTGP